MPKKTPNGCSYLACFPLVIIGIILFSVILTGCVNDKGPRECLITHIQQEERWGMRDGSTYLTCPPDSLQYQVNGIRGEVGDTIIINLPFNIE